jgi:hypothetical protein
LVEAFLLILAAPNLLVSYTFPDHPVMAMADATMAVVLAVGATMYWRSS